MLYIDDETIFRTDILMIRNDMPFWEKKTLAEMTRAEWEALCDRCGRCCVHKIEDAERGEVYFTDVACRLLDIETCQCQDYAHRSALVPDCVPLTAKMVTEIHWLPQSCAYRRLMEGRGLAWWHPLISGDPNTVKEAGVSVCGRVVQEMKVDLDALEDRVVSWLD